MKMCRNQGNIMHVSKSVNTHGSWAQQDTNRDSTPRVTSRWSHALRSAVLPLYTRTYTQCGVWYFGHTSTESLPSRVGDRTPCDHHDVSPIRRLASSTPPTTRPLSLPGPQQLTRAHHAVAAGREWGHIFLTRSILVLVDRCLFRHPTSVAVKMAGNHRVACSVMEVASERTEEKEVNYDGIAETRMRT